MKGERTCTAIQVDRLSPRKWRRHHTVTSPSPSRRHVYVWIFFESRIVHLSQGFPLKVEKSTSVHDYILARFFKYLFRIATKPMASERQKIPVRSASEVFRCEFFRNRKRVVDSTTSILSWIGGICDRMGHAPSPTQPRPLARDFALAPDSKPPNKSASCIKRQDRFHGRRKAPVEAE